jgi:hypothetical protein
VINLAFYQVSSFYFDESTGNVFLYISKSVDVSYDHAPDDEASDIYEAQIYLDGGLSLIGKQRPASNDAEVSGGFYGRSSNPGSVATTPLEDAPE